MKHHYLGERNIPLPEELFLALEEFHFFHHHLQILTLKFNSHAISITSDRLLDMLLKFSRTLQYLNLSQNNLDDTSIEEIFSSHELALNMMKIEINNDEDCQDLVFSWL